MKSLVTHQKPHSKCLKTNQSILATTQQPSRTSQQLPSNTLANHSEDLINHLTPTRLQKLLAATQKLIYTLATPQQPNTITNIQKTLLTTNQYLNYSKPLSIHPTAALELFYNLAMSKKKYQNTIATTQDILSTTQKCPSNEDIINHPRINNLTIQNFQHPPSNCLKTVLHIRNHLSNYLGATQNMSAIIQKHPNNHSEDIINHSATTDLPSSYLTP